MKSLKKQLMAAIAMCLVAVIALSSATYAWFSMNAEVKATDMNVKAQAENGIVISADASDGSWKTTAAAKDSSTKELYPTSTVDGSAWYHNTSKSASNATDYTTEEYESVTNNKDGNGKYYYAEHTFYIKSATSQDLTRELMVKNVNIAGLAKDLDNSVRVLVECNEKTFLYAPSSSLTKKYTVAGTIEVEPFVAGAADAKDTGLGTIPGTSNIPVKVYVFFEGEDADCKSDNITAELDTLTVDVTFEAVEKVEN